MSPAAARRWAVWGVTFTTLAVALDRLPAGAQESGTDLARALQQVSEGPVQVAFETDDGVLVCADGSIMTGGGSRIVRNGRWAGDGCETGTAQVTLSLRGGRVVEISRPGPRGESAKGTDLGLVSGPEAAAFFMELATEGPQAVAERALVPAVLARNATIWPALASLARDRSRGSKLRRRALFWLGQDAAAAVNGELEAIAGDESELSDVRDAAIFALSQRPEGEGVSALMEIVQTSEDSRVRKKAIFWLAQSTDPRVVPFFEEILRGSGG